MASCDALFTRLYTGLTPDYRQSRDDSPAAAPGGGFDRLSRSTYMVSPLSLRLLPLLLAAGLTACASVGPDYRAPAVAVPPAWQAPSPDASAAATAPDSLANWWERLADPQLSALVADALAANPDLDAARAALRAARASRDAASAQRAPSVGASGGVTRSTALGAERTLYDAGFDAAWELDVFGGLRRAVEAADADSAAALADLRAAQMRLAIARANLASQTETLQITQWRSQAGLASALDVEQARSNRESTRAQIPTLATGRAAAEHRLAVLTGRAPGSLHEVLTVADGARAGLLPVLPASVGVSIPAEALRQRPDIAAAERRLAAATARVGQAEAARYPSFSLGGSIGLQALGLSTFTGGGQVARSLAASVSGPVFDAGRLRAQVDVQDALREQQLAAYRKAVLGALEDVQNALVALSDTRLREQALTSAADAARNAALYARHRYASGLIDFQTVLSTERSLLTIEDNLASAEAARLTALVQLYKALGGGWAPGDSTETHAPESTP